MQLAPRDERSSGLMRRLAHPLLASGTLGIVAGFMWLSTRGAGAPAPARELLWSACYAALLMAFAHAGGLPDVARSWRCRTAVACAAAIGAAAVFASTSFAVGHAVLPRAVVVGSMLVFPPWALVCTAVAWYGRLTLTAPARVVVVAERGDPLSEARPHVRQVRPFVVVGSVSAREARPTMHRPEPLIELVRRRRSNVVVLGSPMDVDAIDLGQLSVLQAEGVSVWTRTRFCEEWLGRVPLLALERTALIVDAEAPSTDHLDRVKRCLDVAVALVACVPLLALVPIVAVRNRSRNPGPLFASETYVGLGGRPVRLLRFRTQPVGGDVQDGTRSAREPLTARVELLPRTLNVLRGDLSIVGPAPQRPDEAARLALETPAADLRHAVRPGVTGWAQARCRTGTSELERLAYDVWYVRRRTLALDVRLALRGAGVAIASAWSTRRTVTLRATESSAAIDATRRVA